MKFFFNHFLDYFNKDFNWGSHIALAVFLAFSLILNYTWSDHQTLYASILNPYHYQLRSVGHLFIFYLSPFLFAAIIISVFSKKKIKEGIFFNSKFWIFSLIGLGFLSLDSSYYIMRFTNELYGNNLHVGRWIRSCVSNLSSLITVIIPLYLLYFTVKHFKPELYGLRLNGAKIIPYFWLILFMIPFIYLVSFQPDFLETYPTYTDYHEYHFLGIAQWMTVGIYELSYGFDFLSVELFFRGFMVIALSRFVGKDVILPMVAVYCFLHFGKPAGEAISSIFGGYILGILAYSSRNIYGGLIAHLGVAWGMEYMAYLNI